MMEIPCVAIGGITAENCAPLVQAGAEFLAVVGAVWNHPDGPAAGVQAMLKAIEASGTEFHNFCRRFGFTDTRLPSRASAT